MRNRSSFLVIAAVILVGCSSTARTGASASPSTVQGSSRLSAASPSANPSQTNRSLSLSAIQRLNAQVGFIASWRGRDLGLAKTTDAGASWKRLDVPTSTLTKLRFIDEQTGWVSGLIDRGQPGCDGSQPCQGVVLRTQDAGQSWQTVFKLPTNGIVQDPILQLQAVDGQRAWVVTVEDPTSCQSICQAVLLRTVDAGRTWTTLLKGRINLIRFANATRGWIALSGSDGSTSEVRMTSDAGTTWQAAFGASDGQAVELDAASTTSAWFLTRNGGYCTSSNCERYGLYQTLDGGLSWKYLNNPHAFACSIGQLGRLLFASTSQGWVGLNLGAGGAAGSGGIMSSHDGGRSWHCSTTPPNMAEISAADPLHVWASGEVRGTGVDALYSTEDGGVSWHRFAVSSLS
jgi:photosystem II stability/assembly factor-like uncharacterized protein